MGKRRHNPSYDDDPLDDYLVEASSFRHARPEPAAPGAVLGEAPLAPVVSRRYIRSENPRFKALWAAARRRNLHVVTMMGVECEVHAIKDGDTIIAEGKFDDVLRLVDTIDPVHP